MSGPGGHQHTGRTRFQIASRLGGFRDTAALSDPFGTGATLYVRRKGSSAYWEWGKGWLNNDPITRSVMEEQILGSTPVVLTKEEEEVVETARKAASNETEKLLSIVDRLVDTKQDLDQSSTAIRRALATGRVTIADIAAGSLDLKRKMDEAAFLLAGWDNFPDGEGNPIPYDQETVRELLTDETPLQGVGMDQLLLSVEPWTIRIEQGEAAVESAQEAAEAPEPLPPIILIRPGLTFGRAYALWLHWASERADLFRGELVEAATKNSAAPSDPNISSGGDTSSVVPAAS